MATDDEYLAFLDKVNRDPSEGYVTMLSQDGATREFKARDEGASVPAAIAAVTTDRFFTSDADEPFVPVVLAWDEAGKTLPDEGEWWLDSGIACGVSVLASPSLPSALLGHHLFSGGQSEC